MNYYVKSQMRNCFIMGTKCLWVRDMGFFYGKYETTNQDIKQTFDFVKLVSQQKIQIMCRSTEVYGL